MLIWPELFSCELDSGTVNEEKRSAIIKKDLLIIFILSI
jgi:hypothetical protein